MRRLFALLALFAVLLPAPCQAQESAASDYHRFAPTPPMGWNSWDIFGTTITEQQARQQADAMAEHLLPAGYDVLTVDIQWYEPNAKGHVYKPGAPLAMDDHSRLVPAPNRFPSSANGAGFKPLADYVHSKGLRFGIHIMRGIPRQAVHRNTPLLGTDARAADVAVTDSTCPWNPDMYGVDLTRPGGQAYYDSLFAMYADWGIDYVKVDDISRPYDATQQAEIEAIRRAIDKTGRPIVLSLSPGATPLRAGPHVAQHANLWRITDDFWDRWGALHAMFERLHAWTPHRRTGAWPDADMLPLGVIQFNRRTNFTPAEQRTLMTLWSIGRSPLIFGGDMTRLDDQTLAMLTNRAVLAVNQHSSANRQVSRQDDLIVWAADAPDGDKYVALFNARSREGRIDFDAATYATPVISGEGNAIDIRLPVAGSHRKLALFVRDGQDGISWDHAVWREPTLTGPAGELSLTDLKWTAATSGWGAPRVNQTCEGKPLVVAGGEVTGLGTHANSIIVYELPPGYDTFQTQAVLTTDGSVEFGVLLSDEQPARADTPATVSVDWQELGLSGPARVLDLWTGQDLGEFSDRLERPLPFHDAGLYRVSPIR